MLIYFFFFWAFISASAEVIGGHGCLPISSLPTWSMDRVHSRVDKIKKKWDNEMLLSATGTTA